MGAEPLLLRRLQFYPSQRNVGTILYLLLCLAIEQQVRLGGTFIFVCPLQPLLVGAWTLKSYEVAPFHTMMDARAMIHVAFACIEVG